MGKVHYYRGVVVVGIALLIGIVALLWMDELNPWWWIGWMTTLSLTVAIGVIRESMWWRKTKEEREREEQEDTAWFDVLHRWNAEESKGEESKDEGRGCIGGELSEGRHRADGNRTMVTEILERERRMGRRWHSPEG